MGSLTRDAAGLRAGLKDILMVDTRAFELLAPVMVLW